MRRGPHSLNALRGLRRSSPFNPMILFSVDVLLSVKRRNHSVLERIAVDFEFSEQFIGAVSVSVKKRKQQML